jgi:hypothetical protein
MKTKLEPTTVNKKITSVHQKTEEISVEDFEEVLKKSKNRKSPGMDDIYIELLKYGGLCLKEGLLNVFNQIWKSHEIPI